MQIQMKLEEKKIKQEVRSEEHVESIECEQPRVKTTLASRLGLILPSLSLQSIALEHVRAPASVTPILSEHLRQQSDGKNCSI
ncbi:hypothetical protein Plhal703r1_c03g0013951 [Plasmopara halstedii]